MNEFQRFSACQLGLMNADLAARSAGDARNACARERDKLRGSLVKTGLRLKPGSKSVLLIEDYQQLLADVSVGDLEQTLALLVELCASQPWAVVKHRPALDQRAREAFLGRLAVDLPGESDEDDIEYIDEFLKKGREAGWGSHGGDRRSADRRRWSDRGRWCRSRYGRVRRDRRRSRSRCGGHRPRRRWRRLRNGRADL
jgi:hypothetical protein